MKLRCGNGQVHEACPSISQREVQTIWKLLVLWRTLSGPQVLAQFDNSTCTCDDANAHDDQTGGVKLTYWAFMGCLRQHVHG